MTTPQEYRPLAPSTPASPSRPPQPEAAQPPRFTDWISYARAVCQPAPPATVGFSNNSAH